ncbi:MAG: hypothetical protein IJV43_10045 [Oscillospiraceae bacterium]|nr:hypothetical protein [Oscillospiraceae bacterium]
MTVLSFCFDAAIVVLGATGAALSFRAEGWTAFQYYTLDSNLLLLLACAVQAWYEACILRGKRFYVPSWARVLKYFAVCAVMVTLFVVLLILVPMAGGLPALPTAMLSGAMLYHHLLCPVLGVLSFALLDRVSLPDRRVTLWAVAPTLLYAFVTIVLNAARLLRGPYPFLYVYEQPLYMSVVWCAVICGLAWVLAFLVWRLALRLSEPRERGFALPEAEAWTADGYIKNQDALSAYVYRTIPASDNSCGPVAAFDLRRRAGQDAKFADVLAEMDGMHLLRVPGPTFLYVMRRYLRKYLPGWREVRGQDAAVAAAEESRMGVFRYHEQKVPHFVPYFRAENNKFRFFNVSDGQEDVTLTMAEFAKGHFSGGSVKLIYWE